jgi:hypothetical protein
MLRILLCYLYLPCKRIMILVGTWFLDAINFMFFWDINYIKLLLLNHEVFKEFVISMIK